MERPQVEVLSGKMITLLFLGEKPLLDFMIR
jgi:hypothetical protein